ncbi:hypothetical protein LTR60_007043, partial [Cryomyces antarcticus]
CPLASSSRTRWKMTRTMLRPMCPTAKARGMESARTMGKRRFDGGGDRGEMASHSRGTGKESRPNTYP